MRLPCSLTHCHQPLRGAVKTSGGRLWSSPGIVAVTLNARAGVRSTDATTVTSARSSTCCFSHALSTFETCSIGGPAGFRNLGALPRNSPGLVAPVTKITALWRLWRAAGMMSASAVCATLTGEVSARAMSASLPSGPSRPLTPLVFVKVASNIGTPSMRRFASRAYASCGSTRLSVKVSWEGSIRNCRTWPASHSADALSAAVQVRWLPWASKA